MSDLFHYFDDLIVEKIIGYMARNLGDLNLFFNEGGRFKRICLSYLYHCPAWDVKSVLQESYQNKKFPTNSYDIGHIEFHHQAEECKKVESEIPDNF
jgi:hypothetical protein